jgi:hypothetical protein
MATRMCWKKGAILLQTIVMSVILSMVAVMLFKWVMARAISVNRTQNSAQNTAISSGYAMSNASLLNVNWSIPPNANTTTDYNKFVVFSYTGGGSTRYRTNLTDPFNQ